MNNPIMSDQGNWKEYTGVGRTGIGGGVGGGVTGGTCGGFTGGVGIGSGV